MNSRLIAFAINFIIINYSYSQTNDECKYFQVLTYIKYNSKFNNQLKENITLSKAMKKSNFIEFNVTPWVEFIEIRQFKDSIKTVDSININRDILANDRLYYETYNFIPYKSTFLEKIFPSNDNTKLFLTFSKLIGNTLLVEILNSDNLPNRIRRIGSGVKILFIFEQSGIIKTALFNRVFYN